MTERVIVNGEAWVRPEQVGRATQGMTSRVSAALASPVGVITIVPLLVLLLGLILTLVGQSALKKTSLSMAEARFVEQTHFASQRLGQALLRAEPVLDRLEELALAQGPEHPLPELARTLRDLMRGRSGMTQAYVAYPDGTFRGVYEDEQGRILFQESRVGETGSKIEHYVFRGDALVLEKEELTDYDPRQRDWYKLALSRGTRSWTEPYPFFTLGHTGVTRTSPVFSREKQGELRAVVAVDFDASALSAFMADVEREDQHVLVYAGDGALIAYPRAAERIEELRPQDHALHFRDLNDPLLNAFFARERDDASSQERLSSFEGDGETWLVTVSEVDTGSGLSWRVASMASEQSVLGALHLYQRRSLGVAVAALALTLFVVWLFARHVIAVRREMAQARAEAEVAVRRVTELGSYRLISCLGKGGMGEVWKARHQLLAREAAVKLISADLSTDSDGIEVRERFKREAQTIAALRSRNTVALFDYGVTREGTFFYVMELLEGIDLETLVASYGAQPAGRVIQILLQACNSLGEAHDAGLVHRDVKPANLFLCRAADEVDVVKVLDFGLVLAPHDTEPVVIEDAEGRIARLEELHARAAISSRPPESSSESGSISTRLTRAGDYLGTPAFIAPEQAMGAEVDGRADLYALGCIAWWLLTAKLPFEAPTALAMMLAHMQRPPGDLRALARVPLPEPLAELVLRCMQKDPKDRPESAQSLARALRSIELSPEQEWTEEKSREWWDHHIPREPVARASFLDTVLESAS